MGGPSCGSPLPSWPWVSAGQLLVGGYHTAEWLGPKSISIPHHHQSPQKYPAGAGVRAFTGLRSRPRKGSRAGWPPRRTSRVTRPLLHQTYPRCGRRHQQVGGAQPGLDLTMYAPTSTRYEKRGACSHPDAFHADFMRPPRWTARSQRGSGACARHSRLRTAHDGSCRCRRTLPSPCPPR